MSVTKRVWLVALLVCGLYGVAIATVTWNGAMHITGALTVDGGCTGCGGAFVPLESHTASASGELDFTSWYSGSYDVYQIEFVGLVPTTNALGISLQCSTNGGSSYDTGNNYSWALSYGYTGGGGGTGANSTSLISLVSPIGNGLYGFNGSFQLFNAGSTSIYKAVSGYGTRLDTNASSILTSTTSGYYLSTSAVNAFRVFSGTIGTNTLASGTVRVYGLAH